MAIIATTNSNTREPIEAGNYLARCYQMIQVGTVTEVINGEAKVLPKVRIGWEFPNDKKVFNEERGPEPIVFNEEYTLSMHEKASLRKMLASWRGKDFTPDEAKAFDITVLIGKACFVNIIHTPSKRDPLKIYAKIGSVSSVPKGVEVPAQILPSFILSYDDFSFEKFETLPDFIKDKMKTSAEFIAMTAPAKTVHADGKPAPVRNESANVLHVEPLDDLPF